MRGGVKNMSIRNNLFKFISTASAALALTAPAGAFASQAWSNISVVQRQDVTSWTNQTNLQQEAEINSWVRAGDAKAEAQAAGQQQLISQGNGFQEQKLATGASLDWQSQSGCDTGSCVPALGKTETLVDQKQVAVSVTPMAMRERARVWDGIWFGGQVAANNAGRAEQSHLGTVYDPGQSQTIHGASQAEGKIDFRPRCGNACGWLENVGGQLETFVNVTVRNLLSF